MKSSVCALAILVAVVGSFWAAGPGCAGGDDDIAPCRIQLYCSNGVCCGGAAGGWNVMTRTCTCPDGGGEVDTTTDAHDDGVTTDDGGGHDDAVTTDDGGGHDDGGTPGGGPGSACNCDSDCSGGDATHAPICVSGVCMLEASATCSADGSTAECPAHLRCWPHVDTIHFLCWPDCDFFTGCVGDCDGDGSCVPSATTTCDGSCGGICS
jgi:hypothetical protein